MNLIDVLKIKFPTADFRKDIILQDDGNGPYIAAWALVDTQPTQDVINQWLQDPTVLQSHTFKQNVITNAPILAKLAILDLQSIRALREPSTASTTLLNSLTTQAVALRAQLLPTS